MCEAVNKIPLFLSKRKEMKQFFPQVDPGGKHPSCDGGHDMQ